MANTTNFNWETPDDTDLVKDGAAAMRTLGNSIDTSFVDLKGGTTGQILSKASNTDLDYTWVTTDDANAIQNAIVDAKGDLIAASANDTPARLAVGANDLLLTAASGEATGLKYTGDWTTWTPTYTNFTLGNGTVTARYQKIGKTVNFSIDITFGSTTSVSGLIQVSVPVNASNAAGAYFANGRAFDSSTTLNWLLNAVVITNFVYVFNMDSSGTYIQRTATSSTAPITWATGDTINLVGSYEVA
jgi:hypothetical protein